MSSSGKTITFSYDPKGIRNSKTVNGVKHDYVLEGTKLIRDVHNGVDYVYDAEDQVCGMVYEGNAYYFYKNLQGDVISITNAGGTEIARYSYDAWGVCTITGLTELGTAVANKNVFRYRSYIYDADLGWYYLQSRYYDPQTGRFINGDEVAYLGMDKSISYNLYAYCGNDSVNKIDPFGKYYSIAYAIFYAKKYWNNPNKDYPFYGNKNDDSGRDCANFVSQCLFAGGMEQNNTWHSWSATDLSNLYAKDPRIVPTPRILWERGGYDTNAWTVARELYKYLLTIVGRNYYCISSKKDINNLAQSGRVMPGDVVFFYKKSSGQVGHVGLVGRVVTTRTENNIYFYAHTKPRNGDETTGKNRYGLQEALKTGLYRNFVILKIPN